MSPLVLNVGGGPTRSLPQYYEGFKQHLLDIDPAVNPDIVCDARLLKDKVEANTYDAIHCSHNLEHFYQHEVPVVLAGFLHVLKPGGFIDVAVPNITALMQDMLSRNHDINDVWYRTGQGLPITFHDVLFGWSKEVSRGNEFYAHKCAFTALSLNDTLESAGFERVQVVIQGGNLIAKGFKPCQ